MTTLSYFADERDVPESTLTELFFEAVDRFGDGAALQRMRSETVIEDISYRDVLESVKRVAHALREHGLDRGDSIALLSENRPEWALVDYACLCSGITAVPVYPSLPVRQVAYILENSGARLVFTSTREQMEKVLEALSEVGDRRPVVVFDPPTESPEGVTSWEAFLARGHEGATAQSDADFKAQASSARPHDPATVLYTSGTTGPPKGVILTHNNIASNVRAADMVLKVLDSDNTVSFLPLSHILQRMVDFLFFWRGCTIGYPRSIDTLVADMKVLRPTIVVSVPRIYEKIYNRVMDASGPKKALLDWAVGVADRAADERLAGRRPTGLLGLQYAVADRLVFGKVKAAVGGHIRFFVSGGGPLSPELNRFFYSIGLVILEGYGLTETSPVTNVNTIEDFRIGTVGKPLPGTEVRIADDGEILIRGPQVMKGYLDNPEATAEAIDDEGWFATGDIGEIDADGFLSITDRKKDLIVTAGGKNVAPQPIENRLKTHPLVDQAVVVGDKRRYCSLLVVPEFPALEAWARSEGITWSSREDLTRNPRVVAHVQAELRNKLEGLASFETPKKVALIPEEFTVENGFLTPSLKVKRRVVQERLDSVIDGLYAEEPADETEF